MNRQTGEWLENESEHIKQSIADILLTPKGSRIMRRDYGSNLKKLLAKPISTGLALQMSAAVVMALQKWEHRITVQSFNIAISEDRPHRLIGTLKATIKQTGQPLTMEGIRL